MSVFFFFPLREGVGLPHSLASYSKCRAGVVVRVCECKSKRQAWRWGGGESGDGAPLLRADTR